MLFKPPRRRFEDDFNGAGGGASLPTDVAFGNDLQIGRVVWCDLGHTLSDYTKEGARPMLVTGLWRYKDWIEKIEVLKYSSQNDRNNMHPDRLIIDDPKDREAFASPLGGVLKCDTTYIIDNTVENFPIYANKSTDKVKDFIWPEVLVRRAFTILHNPNAAVYYSDNGRGKGIEDLTREGFCFMNISNPAVYSDVMIPEVHMKDRNFDAGILEQQMVDAIAYYANDYTMAQMRESQKKYFHFPPFEHWDHKGLEPKNFPFRRKPNASGAAPHP